MFDTFTKKCTRNYTAAYTMIGLFLHISQCRPQGFRGPRENGYFFSGSWGALVIILGDLGSKLIVLGI